jgi:hypothetical protein
MARCIAGGWKADLREAPRLGFGENVAWSTTGPRGQQFHCHGSGDLEDRGEGARERRVLAAAEVDRRSVGA